ncbi:GyrI-like domain-containing protein [Inediibacterium massiliense]|uniref:GyrI-like domain-containing protein n=1 Tax=Inediibacterium massiliense TaxID=1658111 RepID=UPI0006B5A210|nr:GyrI-like domain-containing protein [Inediibacterium massiliense]
MNYKIEQWPAFTVSGYKQTICTNDAFHIVPQIWDTAWKDGTIDSMMEICMKADYRPSGFLGISVGGQWGDSEKMDYYIAVTTYVDALECKRIDSYADMISFEFPQATWVILEANGQLPDAVQRVYTKFYTEWLPNSGYELSDLPVIESYMQNNRQAVWIAIVKK